MSTPDFKKAITNVLLSQHKDTNRFGLADLKANTSNLVESIFPEGLYSREDQSRLVQWFGKQEVEVRGEAPRLKAHLPCVVLLREDGEEDTAFAGDFFGYGEQEDFTTVELEGAKLTERMVVEVWARKTLARDALLIAIRELLFRARPWFRSLGLKPISLRRTEDGQQNFSEEKKPLVVHRGRMVWQATYLVTWEKTFDRLRHPELESWGIDELQNE
jgi:hypothetical protein